MEEVKWYNRWVNKWYLLLLALIIFPPIGIYGIIKTNLITRNYKIIISIIFAIIFIKSIMPKSEEEKREERLQEIKYINDSIKRKTDYIKNEISKIDMNLKNISYNNIVFGIYKYKKWSNIINDTSTIYTNDEINNLKNELKKRVVKTQVKELPLLRKKLIEIMGDKAWESNIEIYGDNKKLCKNIYLSSIHFYSNKRIKIMNDEIYDNLTLLRFKRVNYLPHRDYVEYTYFNIDSKEDSELY